MKMVDSKKICSIRLNSQENRTHRKSTIDVIILFHEYNMRIFDDIRIHESRK